MSTATLERFPKTVSACHAEIIRLRKSAEEFDGDNERVTQLEAERDELKDEIEEAGKKIDDLEKRVGELEDAENPDAVGAIDQFLYEVERPVGQFKFDVIHGPATDRAILGLYAAAGRQP